MESVWEVTVRWKLEGEDPRARAVRGEVLSLFRHGPPGASGGERIRDLREGLRVAVADRYFLRSRGLSAWEVERVARAVLADPVTESCEVRTVGGGWGPSGAPGVQRAVVLRKPGVMDPVEGSLLQALEDLGIRGTEVRRAAEYSFFWAEETAGGHGRAPGFDREAKRLVAENVLSNPAIESAHWEDDPPPEPFRSAAPYRFEYREVPLEGLSDEELLETSRRRQLSLNLEEMRAIRDHFATLGRAPSDVELETLAQTWSEHCCHKTFTGTIEHEVVEETGAGPRARRETIQNLLRSTIRRATEEIAAPWCLSVFVDNAGAIEFDDAYAVTFKVETHNHPSAIEPYGGAGTGIGGVLRDTVGTGLGAKPIVSTDVFCFGPPDLSPFDVPPGALHPLRVLKGVVAGVRDYGNRMGIPTASGAVYFDRRYTGNPLVFCGSIGLIPRSALEKSVRPGDRIYLLGGRTGRDGIHGATFSSAELSEESEVVSSGAVQIGNPIEEKKLFDAILAARDRRLYRAITDCGAGGLSSAVGEMGASTGAAVHLERVPLKYEGLAYWEIWVSEAQERMVLAVPPERARELEALARSEDVECTDLGEFTDSGRLVLFYDGNRVADLSLEFLHRGRPRWTRRSVVRKGRPEVRARSAAVPAGGLGEVLRRVLASPNVASKEWTIRQYDHEVQGGSVLKPLQGAGEDGPGDGVVFRPRLDSWRGVAIGCGMNPLYGDLDPYRMAVSAVDEAVRNVVAAGGRFDRTALLDNFSWGDTDRPEVLGTLVEAARGCYDAAASLRTPFISGKDSLRNEYRVGDRTISIPPSLLISSIAIVDDVRRAVSMDAKGAGSVIVLVGETRRELGGSHFFLVLGEEGGVPPGLDLALAPRIHRAVSGILARGLASSCHDLSEGGLAAAAAEMAFSGEVGIEIRLASVPREEGLGEEEILFSESNARYLLEVRPERAGEVFRALDGLPAAAIGETVARPVLLAVGLGGRPVLEEALADLKRSWKATLDFG